MNLQGKFGIRDTLADVVHIAWADGRNARPPRGTVRVYHPELGQYAPYPGDDPRQRAEDGDKRQFDLPLGGELLPHHPPTAMARIVALAEASVGRKIEVRGWSCTSTRKTYLAHGVFRG